MGMFIQPYSTYYRYYLNSDPSPKKMFRYKMQDSFPVFLSLNQQIAGADESRNIC